MKSCIQQFPGLYPDGGHSIIVIMESEALPGEDTFRFAVPAPIRIVMQSGWIMRRGRPWFQLPYDKDKGLIVSDEDVEYVHIRVTQVSLR